ATAQLRTIQPTDYPTWRQVRRELALSDYDRQIVEEVTASIEAQGLQQPLCLGVDADGGVYLTDGHHRAIALMNLRVRHFH
ncbi:ParB N-terminal domain-containing protein, partial [Streptomyces sp. A73]|nr:ParB N-terminal domain-containing protein [Streptomyces sp. A73]